MDNKYRLLDVGEFYIDPEMLTVSNGWQRIEGSGYVQKHTVPLRRTDDGKGKYVLIDRPAVIEMGDSKDISFWKWGVGWVKADETSRNEDASIWRRERERVQPTTALWVVVPSEWKRFRSWEEACTAAKAEAISKGDGWEYAVCHLDRTFRCEVSVVEREVGK